MTLDRFVTDERFERSLARVAGRTPGHLATLRAWRVQEAEPRALQFYFHTNEQSKAAALGAVLAARGYAAKVRPSSHPQRWEPTWLERASWIVSGLTPLLPMSQDRLLAWGAEMGHLGREHDCEFEGWLAPTPDFLERNDDFCLQVRQDGTLALTLYQWNAASEAALAGNDIYWVTPGSGVPALKVLEPYAHKIRGLLSPHETLSLDDIGRLSALEQVWLPQARDVHGDYRQLARLHSFTCLAADKLDPKALNNPALRHVHLRGARKLKSLKPLDAWHGLESLVVASTPLASLEGLGHCASLRELRLGHCRSLADAAGLAQVPQLEILEVFKAPKLQDCSPIAALPHLRWIALVDVPATLPSLDVLQHWPEVRGAWLLLRIEAVDLDAPARHPCLSELVAYTHEGFELPTEDALRVALGAHGRAVRSTLLRPRDRHPSIQATFESPYWRVPALHAGHTRQFVT